MGLVKHNYLLLRMFNGSQNLEANEKFILFHPQSLKEHFFIFFGLLRDTISAHTLSLTTPVFHHSIVSSTPNNLLIFSASLFTSPTKNGFDYHCRCSNNIRSSMYEIWDFFIAFYMVLKFACLAMLLK